MGGSADGEIPLLLMLFYLFHEVEWAFRPLSSLKQSLGCDLRGRHCQVGSLAGAAHLLKDNTGVLRGAQ